jgi:hypothetical protein
MNTGSFIGTPAPFEKKHMIATLFGRAVTTRRSSATNNLLTRTAGSRASLISRMIQIGTISYIS